MASDFHWLGVSEFRAALDHVLSEASVAARAAVSEGAHLIQREAMTRARVVTGTLRRSIAVDALRPYGLGGWRTQVGPTVVYGRRVELGFHGRDRLGRNYDQDGKPYFEPAYDAVRDRLPLIFERHWARAIA